MKENKRNRKKASFRDEMRDALRHYQPLNRTQEIQWDAMDSKSFVFATGYAGCGKTYQACAKAAYLLFNGEIDTIVITKPMVDVERDYGALPGEIDEKVTPWMQSVIVILEELLGKERVQCDMRQGRIAIEPLNFCRGRTFNDAFIIVDEAQNCTKEAIKMLMTRIGEDSTMVFCGDTGQIDLPSHIPSGLIWICNEIVRQNRPIEVIRYQKKDCVRSGPCRLAIDIIEAAE